MKHTSKIKEYIQTHLDDLDEKSLNEVYSMMYSCLENDNLELSEDQKEELDRRIAAHESGKSKSYSWEEVQQRIQSRL